MHVVRKAVSFLLTGFLSVAILAGCHGGTNSTASITPPTVSFTYAAVAASSTVSPFTVSFDASASKDADGTTPSGYSWTFGDSTTTTATNVGVTITHTYAAAGNYDVTLTVTDDHGTTASITRSVLVTGTTTAAAQGVENWSWMSGAKYDNNVGTYETEFTPDPRNTPSARQFAATWYTPGTGIGQGEKFWMFGGAGYDSVSTSGLLNDLWYFTPTTGTDANGNTIITGGTWTWIAGSNKANAIGVYPKAGVGTFDPTSMPGARTAAASWTDNNGYFWLFGGDGYDTNGNLGNLNDTWVFNGTTGQARWVAGPNTVNDPGTQSVYPASRAYAATWKSSDGKLWLFGGQTLNSAATANVQLNDLWYFTPSADGTSGFWTLVNAGTSGAVAAYGTQGTAAASNTPGGRISSQTWVDSSGTFWLFGGSGLDSANSYGDLSDVWSYNPTTRVWTWVAGVNTINATEVTGTQGVGASGNTPSARLGTIGWTDASGTILWMFGGSGTDSTGTSSTSDGGGALSELWAFNTQTHLWAYMAGSTTEGTAGIYPVALGAGYASAYSIPGSRIWSSGWLDANNNFWLFGGAGDDAVAASGYLNDLWQVQVTVKPK